MTNTKFRKRALLSSVAMLLVALVALGSATFAWFTSSTTATASGINVQTTQASELQISKTDLSWGTSVNYATTATFEPASSGNNYLRIALVPVTPSGDSFTTETLTAATPAAADFKAGVFDAAGVAYDAVDSTSTAATSITPKTTYSVSVGKLTRQQIKYYKLYV